ncbi:LytR/AlgR family response regulator transcription factor [Haliovirga abyssi]|uniref:DNA-binding response regulator n=1 Tax=Haliovirga abyssi TaxID=2996794 RepID=A0AAU9D8I7_9FUSO|nr:LytTR family DNA-binding domain-containing protein [Haliovirga abyssi]BDU50913.1 hypothetical protein HLVA_14820 [Haliovirga abyssi]
MKFAIIDDSGDILLLLKEILKKHFNDSIIKTYDSGEDFFDNPNHKDFDIIITDMNLPGISGIDIAKLSKSKSNTPVILITANGSSELVRQLFIEKIVDDYLDKPILESNLIERINNVIKANNKYESFIWVKISRDKSIQVDIDNIDYISTSERAKFLTVSTSTNEKYETRALLKEIAAKLPENFIKLTKGLIINKNNIKFISSEELIISFNSNSKVKISRNKLFELKQKL